jgi:tetratricopeptide (TPR) repeat protein
MQEARQKLEEAERQGAAEKQEQALRELEEAKADLERILRQLREEEMERTLALLEARFRKMLEAQLEVYEGTLRLDRVSEDARDHDDEIEAGRLSRLEEAIVREADKALEILLAEGTSVAFPEAVSQMVDVGTVTQGIEEDIIAQLEESIEALQKALEELEKNKTPPGQPAPPGEPQDPALVDMLEEVKMIRALQMRINRRTQRYTEMIGESGTEDADLLAALHQLAERQERVYEATRDLHLGKNQ